MALRIGINGFGRIGRNVLRAGWDQGYEFVHVNDLTSAESLAYLLQHDSVHGGWRNVRAVSGGLEVDGRLVHVSAEKEPNKLPWGEAGVDVVLECTGRFTEGPKAQPHRDAGAPKVIISAPATKVDATFVVGVNHDAYDRNTHHIVSNASCTTNCLAPVAKVLHEAVGLQRGLMTTIHSYTMDQNLLDAPHKDFRRSRAAALNMVPTSTGAAKAIGLVLPALAGRLNGVAIRVPTPNGSLVDLTFTSERPTTKEEINDALRAAAAGPLAGILQATDAPIVSSDIIGNPHSSIADLALTDVIGGTLVKVFSWYDNEWGFSNRMLDLARIMVG